jgi:hypothetical protein
MKYSVELIYRNINMKDLLLILDKLRVGNLVGIPNHKKGDILLKFLCPVYYEGSITYAKFTNDDRRKFIKIANAQLLSSSSRSSSTTSRNSSPYLCEISYVSSIEYLVHENTI